MRHSFPFSPQFYVTAPQPCPYLPDRMERKLFTALQGDEAQSLNDALSRQGFRRSQNVLYRPACAECRACLSVRIDVSNYTPSKNQKRILRRNADLKRRAMAPWASEDQFDLFRRYLEDRHSDGGMADMDIFEFAAMVEETPIRTRIIEYTNAQSDKPLAACLTDVNEDGVSMVYSFFDPEVTKRSLGTFLIQDHINIAIDAGLPYVYLGYWVPGSPKMDYKARFSGLEVFRDGAWQVFDPAEEYENDKNPLAIEPIVDQVAKISVPT